MSSSRWKRVQALFEEADSLPESQRAAFLDRACGGDVAMRAEVESLLRDARQIPSGFLEPRHVPSRRNSEHPPPEALVGRLVGQYKIQSLIASGGMGTVYRAEQQSPRRVVALKLMRAGLVSSGMSQRFKNETNVLARLQHRSIAQIYESGIYAVDGDAELPFFAMEYVPDARFITDYVKQQKLSAKSSFELFAQVCDAVHHGHRKGVIHRDLKPANILVDSYGNAKVIDFGVARATDLDVTLTTTHTLVGDLIGTLQYMSPEQCEADPLGLDTRSDVYSLGVVLYEILTGTLPYEVDRKSVPSAVRTICETIPKRPSEVDRALRGAPESIVLKCLAKDPNERYESSDELAKDIRDFLNGDPVLAGRKTWGSRVGRSIMRHPALWAAVASAALTAAVLTTFSVTSEHYLTYPSRLTRTDDQDAVHVWSEGGKLLHTWNSEPSGIAVAKLVPPGDEFDTSSIALLGFTERDESPWSGSFCLFDLVGDRTQPLLQVPFSDPTIDKQLHEHGVIATEFDAHYAEVYDVFPERLGREIVAVFQHYRVTRSCLRVYDFSGHILYQIWLNGDVRHSYWMHEARTLVLAGINGAAYWPERGQPGIQEPHPRVVFAIRPEANLLSSAYLSEAKGPTSFHARWYNCIWPPTLQDRFSASIARLSKPSSPSLAGRSVVVEIEVDASTHATVQWLLDDQGYEMPDTRRINDPYFRQQKDLPNWRRESREISLADLPPIQS